MDKSPYQRECRCALTTYFKLFPFRRCHYCAHLARNCFGIQFFVIAMAIILLIFLMLNLTDLPILAFEIAIVILFLIVFLGLSVERETNSIVINHYKLQDLVNKKTEALQKAEAFKSNFLVNMTHTLRTPLTSIIGYTNLILCGKCGGVEPKQKEYLSVIERNSRDLFRMIDDILTISRVEGDRLEVNKERVDIDLLIKNLTDTFRELAMDKGIKIKVVSELALNSMIFVDGEKLKHIFLNLLDNALRYTGIDGQILIRLLKQGKHFIFSVEDTGIGIPAEEREKVFQKFCQVSDKKSKKVHGVGLGLAIVKELVEALDGKIWIEANEPCGSKFIFSLPIKEDV